MIEMGVRQHHCVDRTRVEAEFGGILLVEVAATLDHAAIDEDAAAATRLDQVTRPGDAAVGAVEGQFHSPAGFAGPQISSARPAGSSGVPRNSYHSRISRQMSAAVSAYQNRSRSSGSMVPSDTRKSVSMT